MLQRFLTRPKYRLNGIDYEGLAERLDARKLAMVDVVWASDLLAIHAFLSQW